MYTSALPPGTEYAAAFGRTFQVPSDATKLTDFTFYLKDYDIPSRLNRSLVPAPFYAFIMQWDAASLSVVGEPLFGSSMLQELDLDNYFAYTIPTGGVDLAPNTDYVAFFSGLHPTNGSAFDRSPGFAGVGAAGDGGGSGSLVGGSAVVSNQTVKTWSELFNPGAFRLAARDLAAFINAERDAPPVIIPPPTVDNPPPLGAPEPASILMWALFGLVGMAYVWRPGRLCH
jgi:hypothetical protein